MSCRVSGLAGSVTGKYISKRTELTIQPPPMYWLGLTFAAYIRFVATFTRFVRIISSVPDA